jgi:hypothetical protein
MTWHSIPHEPRRLTATEARLDAIYDAARRGLKGDTLALASGLLPTEYRQLCQFDPLAELAELKGRADGEMELSGLLHDAARGGDAKASLEILKHVHGWVAKQQISVDVEQRISITGALEMAEKRIVDWLMIEGTITKPADALTSDGLFTNDLVIKDHGYEPTYPSRIDASSDV